MSVATPFELHVSDDVLADLSTRLTRVRWPDEVPNNHWKYGTQLDTPVLIRGEHRFRAHQTRSQPLHGQAGKPAFCSQTNFGPWGCIYNRDKDGLTVQDLRAWFDAN